MYILFDWKYNFLGDMLTSWVICSMMQWALACYKIVSKPLFVLFLVVVSKESKIHCISIYIRLRHFGKPNCIVWTKNLVCVRKAVKTIMCLNKEWPKPNKGTEMAGNMEARFRLGVLKTHLVQLLHWPNYYDLLQIMYIISKLNSKFLEWSSNLWCVW